MRRDAVRNQELILRTARDVLSDEGIDVGMDVIAGRAGVGVGTVYRHFPNKDALLDALVSIMFDDLVAVAEKALAQDDGTGLETYLRSLGQILADHHGYSSRFVRSHGESGADRLTTLMEQLLVQAITHGEMGDDVTMADLTMLIWGVRGVVTVIGTVAPHAWHRYLDIHLAGLRSSPFPGDRPGLTAQQLGEVKAVRRRTSS